MSTDPQFAVCHCGQMKYDRESLGWWVKDGKGWRFIDKLDAETRVFPAAVGVVFGRHVVPASVPHNPLFCNRVLGLRTIASLHFWAFRSERLDVKPCAHLIRDYYCGAAAADVPNVYSQALIECTDLRFSGFDGCGADEIFDIESDEGILALIAGHIGGDRETQLGWRRRFMLARLKGSAGPFEPDPQNIWRWLASDSRTLTKGPAGCESPP